MDGTEQIGHSTNLVGVSTVLLASPTFNEHPQVLHISGVLEMNPSLFEMLEEAEDLADAGEAFYKYMVAIFGLDPEQHEKGPHKGVVRRFRSSFLRLLKGWGYDSNGPEGAVLKGWVESRFGLFPTFHKEPISLKSQAWISYVEEKMSSRFHNNSIYFQLDLLYEFCQWALARFAAPGRTHLTLYRGVNDFDEHRLIRQLDKRRRVIRMNSLASFTCHRDIADCFGDTILEVQVPLVKVVFGNFLLPTHPLKGEGEHLVIGGDFLVTASYL
ncbi:MAG TPA: NAD(+)--dinitrogen-reductase ADP-D-ribosyltransferase [Rhodospirillaceae bacterium]|nr:NAD(+)--dinitrogen-reductase ADP-D-ribosyltransferase [Rhodospirillaceae bacterium]